MKKFSRIVSCVVAVFVLVSCLSVYSAGDANVVIGNKLTFESGNEPFIYQERTMMPLRAISEALDATVYWFSDKSVVQIVSYDKLLSLQIGNDLMSKYTVENGEANEANREVIQLEVAPMIHNDRTYVPLRAIAEAFDASITWDNPNRSAIIIPAKRDLNYVSISEMTALPDATLCAAYGVICKEESTGLFYLRSLTQDAVGEYSRIIFCAPTKTSSSDNTKSEEYLTQYWTEQFGTENPSGMVVRYTGVTVDMQDGNMRAALTKTTTGIKGLGYYDDYMKSLGLDYVPFSSLNI